MFVVGGVTPNMDNGSVDEDWTAYSYDCDIGRWNTFSLPSKDSVDRQNAACAVTNNGIAYLWGGKRSNGTATKQQPSANMYRLDSRTPSNSTVLFSIATLPSMRYSHAQTMIQNHIVVVLGGFDGVTGDAVSMADVLTFDTMTLTWTHVDAKLDKNNKPANRSSHSQVLMSDGVSILIYGGYDGYHVFNDVAVLDTRTWTWTVKNTNAALQGRADRKEEVEWSKRHQHLSHSLQTIYLNPFPAATMVGTNMIVAFGFTGVSTSLTILSDIEVLDTTTWSWTSSYIPSASIIQPGNNGQSNRTITGLPNTPSMAIIAGAVTGGMVVLVLIVVALYMFNYHQRHHPPKSKQSISELEHTLVIDVHPVKRSIPPEASLHPMNSISKPSVLSPWPSTSRTHWKVVRRAATAPGRSKTHQHHELRISKPDELAGNRATVRRAATTIATATTSQSPTLQSSANEEDDDKSMFDRQEFILQSDEVSPIDEESNSEIEEKTAYLGK
ncbi:hypothetical protein EC973_008366 [Apophysomyces ossiformis]|uniref:Galactose oxidase n=1 Tax=Apophysomyces ossiformis TaxID=679940 RepID=A0A8H7ER37_9FUNG|nr:hypothetical protein EC973_008366 [Apophysomyces ossiformis]